MSEIIRLPRMTQIAPEELTNFRPIPEEIPDDVMEPWLASLQKVVRIAHVSELIAPVARPLPEQDPQTQNQRLLKMGTLTAPGGYYLPMTVGQAESLGFTVHWEDAEGNEILEENLPPNSLPPHPHDSEDAIWMKQALREIFNRLGELASEFERRFPKGGC